MLLFYNIAVKLYFFIVKFLSYFIPKAKLFTEGRKNWKNKLPNVKSNANWIWFQVSSQGEYEDGLSLLKTIKKNYSDYKILLTFFSPSGFEGVKESPADFKMYLPADSAENANFLFNHFNFKAVFFIRHDIWPNYLLEAKKRNIPSFLIFCTLSKHSSSLTFPAIEIMKIGFKSFSYIFCHDKTTELLLNDKFKISNCSVFGSTRVETICEKKIKDVSSYKSFINENECTIVVGSTDMNDEKILIETIQKMNIEKINWIIVPHEIDRNFNHFSNATTIDDFEKDYLKKSNILIVNRIGILFSLYSICDVAIVGGGHSPKGIHNIIEPAVFGKPVLVGPKHRDYPEALALLNDKQAFIYNNALELNELILKIIKNRKNIQISNYINENRNTSSRITEYLSKHYDLFKSN